MRYALVVIIIFSYTFPAYAQMVGDTTIRKSFIKQAIIPATLITYGLVSLESKPLRQFDRYVNGSVLNEEHFSSTIDNYLRYAPIAAVYGINAIGIKGRHNFIDRTLILGIATSLVSGAVTFTKDKSNRLRPNGSDRHSFPSGHTAIAFMSAEFMRQEYGDQSVWYSVAGYTFASATGTIRLFHHAHWFSDVVMGAGYGIISAKLAYLIYPYLKNIFNPKTGNMVFVPTNKGFLFSYSFQ